MIATFLSLGSSLLCMLLVFIFLAVSLKTGDSIDVQFYKVVFVNRTSPFSVPKRKTAFSQWDCCTMKFFIKESLLGSLAYFLFGTEQGGAS